MVASARVSSPHSQTAWGTQFALRPGHPLAGRELPTLRWYGPPLAPRSQARLHGTFAPEAASGPRSCPELWQAPRPWLEETAAAQASAPGGRHRHPRGHCSTANAATTSVNSASSASLATCRAGQPYAPSPLQLPARTAVRAAARPKPRASRSPSSNSLNSLNSLREFSVLTKVEIRLQGNLARHRARRPS